MAYVSSLLHCCHRRVSYDLFKILFFILFDGCRGGG